MRKEIQTFLAALQFYTRFPFPGKHNLHPYLSKSIRYFSLIGLIVGGIGALIYYGSAYIFPHSVSIILSMAGTIVFTGAIHEDGLADVCDGFGGGWTKEDVLRIMKDSCTGTYGVIGLILVLGLKFICLYHAPQMMIPAILITGHGLSRFSASTLLFTLPYARMENSKSGPATGKMSFSSLLIGSVFGIVPLLLFQNLLVFFVFVPLLTFTWYATIYLKKRIGGYTGDCAGAVQQINEVLFYLSLIALWKFI